MNKVEYSCVYNPTLSDYLASMIVIDENGCWIWQGAVSPNGYGTATHNGHYVGAHRLSYRCEHGFLPDSPAVLRHTCDVRLCIKPSHLIPGTHKDNATDRKDRGRQSSKRGSDNGRAQLTEADVLDIRASNETLSTLARNYGVGVTTIADARKGRRWKHLPLSSVSESDPS